MAWKFEEIKIIHEEINRDIQRLDQGMNDWGLTPYDVSYFKDQKAKFSVYALPLVKPRWFGGYQDKLDFLIRDIKYLLDPNKKINSPEAKKRVLLFALVAAQQIVEQSLAYLETKDSAKQTQCLPEIILLQKQIEDGLNVFFPEREKSFNLRLTDLREEYEQAYIENHSGGCFGFFTLKLKLFCRVSTRNEELQFIEDINAYLLENEALQPVERQIIKESALNLVRLKIQDELFGENSLLSRLIVERLTEAGSVNDIEIMQGFLEFCEERNITVPEELVACYQEGLTP
ncbi:hypothetical protein BN59_01733 [Legionella massiliensis]|uniref:Uncharacterized protein n=1 Tax=Legionella massiliensis TaxID=1034943 RepID=A0A078KSQ5_9GAMM|nr:hypothetical protein [Legionella massiliensis]CDZ77450.1 hypothetical protein BN59_01733 [Legionella massiliensis]CEE13188.1 hypothetical protein BN1094_01733 [Legionella massiliensis]